MQKTAIHVRGGKGRHGYIAARKFGRYMGGGLKRHFIVLHPHYKDVFLALQRGDCFAIIAVRPNSSKRKRFKKKILKVTEKGKSQKVFVAHEFSCNTVIPKTRFKVLYKFKKRKRR